MNIEFRAWSKEFNKMIYPNETGWFEGVYTHENGFRQTVQLGTVVNDDRIIPLQYTGTKDKNNRKVYKGDIIEGWVESHWHSGKDKVLKEVEWMDNNCGFNTNIDELENCEVIGNIYENPELLKTQ